MDTGSQSQTHILFVREFIRRVYSGEFCVAVIPGVVLGMFFEFIFFGDSHVTSSEAASSRRRLLLVDGSGYVWRAFHGYPERRRSDGLPTNAVYGFISMVLRPIRDNASADFIAVLFDTGREGFRSSIYSGYKASRPDYPDDLLAQVPHVRRAAEVYGIAGIEQDGFEADDLIATYARHGVEAGMKVTIVSSDKDLMQLVAEDVKLYCPMKKRFIGPEQVVEKFGVPPDRVIDVQALSGDAVDGVPGVPGIGPKIASELIQRFGSLEELLARSGEIHQPKRRQRIAENAELALISKRLVTLLTDVPLRHPLEELVPGRIDRNAVAEFLKEMELGTNLVPRSTGERWAA
jgi:DNA polymerase-1